MEIGNNKNQFALLDFFQNNRRIFAQFHANCEKTFSSNELIFVKYVTKIC